GVDLADLSHDRSGTFARRKAFSRSLSLSEVRNASQPRARHAAEHAIRVPALYSRSRAFHIVLGFSEREEFREAAHAAGDRGDQQARALHPLLGMRSLRRSREHEEV